jgi:hypothetical protein
MSLAGAAPTKFFFAETVGVLGTISCKRAGTSLIRGGRLYLSDFLLLSGFAVSFLVFLFIGGGGGDTPVGGWGVVFTITRGRNPPPG